MFHRDMTGERLENFLNATQHDRPSLSHPTMPKLRNFRQRWAKRNESGEIEMRAGKAMLALVSQDPALRDKPAKRRTSVGTAQTANAWIQAARCICAAKRIRLPLVMGPQPPPERPDGSILVQRTRNDRPTI